MNLRIKKIRKALDLTQKAFAERIGMKQNSIALIESGKRNISDQAILSICREFSVREEWLRTGQGEMFNPKPSDILDQLAYKYCLSNSEYVMIEKFITLRPEVRQVIFDYLREVNAALKEMNPYALAFNENQKPIPMDNFIEKHKKNFSSETSKTDSTTATLEAEYKKSVLHSAPKGDSTASSTTKGKSNKKGVG